MTKYVLVLRMWVKQTDRLYDTVKEAMEKGRSLGFREENITTIKAEDIDEDLTRHLHDALTAALS